MTWGNQLQNTDFRNEAIWMSLDLQFWFWLPLIFYLNFACHVKCLAFYSVILCSRQHGTVQKSSYPLSHRHYQLKVFLALVTWDSTMSHFSLCCSAADLVLARGNQLGNSLEDCRVWSLLWAVMMMQSCVSTVWTGCEGRSEAVRT